MLIYLAGPMRGYPEFNFPAFHAAAKAIRDKGHEVWNPAEHDVEKDGFDPKTDAPHSMSHYMARDLPAVCEADAVAVLPGWEKSEGCKIEVSVARALGKPILRADTLDPVTGDAIKYDAHKPPMSLLPWEALCEVAVVLGFGAAKYSPNNWRRGFAWSRLMDATLRHLAAFSSGERTDPESGRSHLAHAACMILFLLTHERLHLGEDDML